MGKQSSKKNEKRKLVVGGGTWKIVKEVTSNHSGFDVRFITFTDAIFDSLNSKIQQFQWKEFVTSHGNCWICSN